MELKFSCTLFLCLALFSSYLVSAEEAIERADFEQYCSKFILEFKNYGLTPEETECIFESVNFKSALPTLCSIDDRQPTKKFSSYIEFQNRFFENQRAVETASNSRELAQAMIDLEKTRTAWRVSGHQDEIDANLYLVSVAKHECVAR